MPSTIEVDIVDLRNNPLPLWHDCMWNKEPIDLYDERIKVRNPIAEKLKKSDALVIVSPERN